MKRAQLLKLFQKYDVDLVVSGHEHIYEHNIYEYQNIVKDISKLHFIVSGGGGVPIRDLTNPDDMKIYHENYQREGLNAYSIRQEKIYKYSSINHQGNCRQDLVL